MRLLEIDIENFGLFSQQQLAFPDSPVQILYGPNEAGKSTLLQLIRELLFGFTRQNPYVFASHQGTMAATATARLHDGREVRFRRRKGNKNCVQGEYVADGKPIDEDELARLLGGAQAGLFQHVFGISLQELQQGRDSLKRANLGDAIFGSGLGDLGRFQETMARLNQEQGQLYKKRGKQQINRLLSEIDKQQTRLQEETLPPERYEELQQRLREASSEAEQSSGVVREFRNQLRDAQKLLAALPFYHRLAALAARQEELVLPELPHAAIWDDLRRDRERLVRLREQQREKEQALRTCRQGFERADSTDTGIIDHASAILSLNQQIGRIEGLDRDIPLREKEAAAILNEVHRDLRQLDMHWNEEILDRYDLGASQRSVVERLSKERAKLDERRRMNQLQLDETRQSIAELSGSEVPAELHELEGLLEPLLRRGDRLAVSQKSSGQVLARQRKLRRQAEGLWRQLAAAVDAEPGKDGSAESSGTFERALLEHPLPLTATMEQFAQRWQQHAEELRVATEQLQNREAQCAELTMELRQLEQADVPVQGQLDRLRERRDRLLEELLSELATPECSAQKRVEVGRELRHALEAADRCADERHRQAEQVALHEQLINRLQREQSSMELASNRLERAQTAFATLQSDWRELWGRFAFVPADPKTMLQWSSLHKQWCDLNEDDADCQASLETIEREHDELRRAILELVDGFHPAPARLDIHELLELARDLEAQRQQHVAAAHLAETRLPRLRQKQQDLLSEAGELDREDQHWQAQWSGTLRDLTLPEHWDVELAETLLQGLAEASSRRREAQSLKQRVQEMRSDLRAFQVEVSQLAQKLGLSINAEQNRIELVRNWHEQLVNAQEAARDQRRLRAEIGQFEQELSGYLEQVEQITARFQKFQQQWELSSPAEIDELIRVADQRRELDREVDELRQKLELCIAPAAVTDVRERLESTDEGDLQQTVNDLAAQLEAAELRHRESIEQEALARENLDEVSREQKLAETASQLESTRAELATAVDRWAALQIAQTLLRQARERFEQQQQPELLEDVSSIFSRITDGRYVRIRRKLDEEGTLVVEQCDGELKEPSQLSMGSREQLYLAIRLAYIRQHAQSSEPLPVFMDDLLVNFDPVRARNTLEVIHQIGSEVQVVLLTCHRQTVQDVHRQFPKTPITCLGSQDDHATLAGWLQEAKSTTPPRSRRRAQVNADSADQKILFS